MLTARFTRCKLAGGIRNLSSRESGKAKILFPQQTGNRAAQYPAHSQRDRQDCARSDSSAWFRSARGSDYTFCIFDVRIGVLGEGVGCTR